MIESKLIRKLDYQKKNTFQYFTKMKYALGLNKYRFLGLPKQTFILCFG